MAKKQVFIPYGRKSSKEDPKVSRERQRRAITNWADANGVQLGPEVWEQGVSGSKSWRDRGLGQALAACERGEADGIIVEEQSRLSRENGLATAEMWDAFQRANIRLVCVAEGLDTANGDHELSFAMRAALAREQWKQYRRRADDAKRSAIARGVHTAGTVPVGYVKSGRGRPLEVDRKTAPAVRAAFKLRARGASYAAVAAMLDERLPGGPTGRGGWAGQTVTRMLARRVYLGEAHCGEHVNPAAHDPIVDVETFDVVQALGRRAERRNEPAETKSLLAGLVRCGSCNYALDRQMLSKRDGYYVYRCRDRNASGRCDAPVTVSLEALDEYVEGEARAWLAEKTVDRVPAKAELAEVHALIAAARARRAPFEDPRYVAALGVEAALRALAVVDAELEQLDERLGDLAVPGDTDEVVVRRALDVWPTDLGERREMIAAGLEAVIVSRALSRHARVPVADRVELIWRGGPVAAPARPRKGHTRAEVEARFVAP